MAQAQNAQTTAVKTTIRMGWVRLPRAHRARSNDVGINALPTAPVGPVNVAENVVPKRGPLRQT